LGVWGEKCTLFRGIFSDIPQEVSAQPVWHRVITGYERTKNKHLMLRWTIIFLVVAIIAAILGFGGVAAGAASIAKILFFIFLVAFVISLIAGAIRRS
jgi:uncharacterized membrane protein YtjA (UPF0391 family)